MDEYTQDVKQWLNERFRATTADGYFYAHQNIYGFKSPYAEPGIVLRYVIFYNILQTLEQLQFESLLDVGCAEGYMIAAIRQFFDVQVQGTDLSEEACARAREIFQVPAEPVDAIALPYEDEAFDVVLSSETLEHIPNYQDAFDELLRVARKAVIVTVPQDPPHEVAENIRQQIPHAHIHAFNLASFQDLVPDAYTLKAQGLYSSWLRLPYRLIEGQPLNLESRSPGQQFLLRLLNPIITALGKVLNEEALKALIQIDHWLTNTFKTQRQLVFLIIKDASCPAPQSRLISIEEVLKFQVPLHRVPDQKSIKTGSC
ncbi:MAG: class I SAM-dependent methyltransferase [Leptolyngbya sp. SIOISBB]|nr:class I SAM-dependent methyltransferase [Leptolyngbya sp. SIOISBB]